MSAQQQLVRRTYNKSAHDTQTISVNNNGGNHNKNQSLCVSQSQQQQSSIIQRKQSIKALDTKFYENLLQAEEQLSKKRLTQDLINELVGLYARCVEYYDSIQDPIKLYFLEKIQITLTSKSSLKVIFINNGSSHNNSGFESIQNNGSQSARNYNHNYNESNFCNPSCMKTFNFSEEAINKIQNPLKQKQQNGQRTPPNHEKANVSTDKKPIQNQIKKEVAVEQAEEQGKKKQNLNQSDHTKKNFKLPVIPPLSLNQNAKNELNQQHAENVDEIESHAMSTIGETRESVRCSSLLSFGAWNNNDMKLGSSSSLEQEELLKVENKTPSPSQSKHSQEYQISENNNNNNNNGRPISQMLVSFIEEADEDKELSGDKLNFNRSELSVDVSPYDYDNNNLSEMLYHRNNATIPIQSQNMTEEETCSNKYLEGSQDQQENKVPLAHEKSQFANKSVSKQTHLKNSKSLAGLSESSNNLKSTKFRTESPEVYSIPKKKAERLKRFSLFVTMQDEAKQSEMKQDFSNIINRFEIDQQLKDDIVREDIQNQMTIMKSRIEQRASQKALSQQYKNKSNLKN